MSGCLNLSPYKMRNNEEHNSQKSSLEKKGIVSILCSDFSNPKISSSLNNNINININNNTIKRSMSADMSSKKWQENNEFPMKRLQSSDHLQSLVEEEENDKNKKVGPGGAAFEDIWSSILTNKKTDGSGSGSDPAPYVHPLMKRASSLSEKSLEICTESLGSETGSDGFSSPLSDHGEEHEVVDNEEYVVEDEIVRNNYDFVEVGKFGYNNYPVKNKRVNSNGNGNGNNNGIVRSFPPPLLSLAHRDDGSNVEMRTRRQDGRLVVEAVSVPSRNCFRARREDGRLLLTLTNETEDDEEDDFDEEEVVEDVPVSDGVVAKVSNALTFVMEESEAASRLPKTRVINVHTASPVMIMTKLMELTSTRNMSSWPRASNRTVITSLDEGDEDGVLGKKQVEVESKPSQKKATAALLPPRPARAKTAADVLNAYEYYWRRSDSPAAAAVALLTPLAGKQSNAKGVVVSPQVVKDTNKYHLLGHNVKGVPKGEVVLVKAETVGGEYLVPMLRGCKDPRRSLFFWEPFCIATS